RRAGARHVATPSPLAADFWASVSASLMAASLLVCPPASCRQLPASSRRFCYCLAPMRAQAWTQTRPAAASAQPLPLTRATVKAQALALATARAALCERTQIEHRPEEQQGAEQERVCVDEPATAARLNEAACVIHPCASAAEVSTACGSGRVLGTLITRPLSQAVLT